MHYVQCRWNFIQREKKQKIPNEQHVNKLKRNLSKISPFEMKIFEYRTFLMKAAFTVEH